MFKYLSEVLYLISKKRRKKLPFLILLFLVLSFLDLIGISLIGPYVSLVLDSSDDLGGIFGRFIGATGLPNEKESLLFSLGLILVSVFFIKMLFAIWINWKIISFSQNQQIELRSFLMRAYQGLPYTDYLLRNSSEYVYSILVLSGRIQNCTLLLLRMLSGSIVALMIIGVLAYQNIFALLMLVSMLGIVVFSYDKIFRKKVELLGQKVNSSSKEMGQGVNEGIEGFKEVRIHGKEKYFYQVVFNAARNLGSYQILEQVISTIPRFVFELIMILFIVILVLGSIYVGYDLQTLVPTLAMFGVASLRLLPIATMLSSGLATVRFEKDAVSRLYIEMTKFQKTSNSDENQINMLTQESFRNLVLDRVSFRYPNATYDSLKNISLEISAGESIGLIGQTGSGKTTLVDLLLGFLSPYAGEVSFNERPMKSSLDEWRSNVAYLPQEIFLIDDTLRCNVALGENIEEVDESKVYEALNKARLLEFVDQLDEGIDTVIGERGMRLSGGQRQRIALARAFYHERNVIVLDEATSALDNETEREIIYEIEQLKGKKTVIVIAHRLSTVQNCDRIYLLKDGEIVKYGSPPEVLNYDASS